MKTQSLFWIILLGFLSLLIFGYAVGQSLPPAIDWETAYRPAARTMFLGGDPYAAGRFLNAPWLLFLLAPMAFLSLEWGAGVYFLLSLLGFSLAAYRLGAKPLALGLFLLAPPVWHALLNGSVDWIPLLGFALPPQIGLFLVLAKPQVGFTIALFWAAEAWRMGGWREVARIYTPVTLAFGLSFGVYGLWFLNWLDQPEEWWNASLFPYSIPFGLWLLYLALRRRRAEYAMPAAPCLSPYVLFHSWAGAVISLVKAPRWLALVVGAMWLVIIVRLV